VEVDQRRVTSNACALELAGAQYVDVARGALSDPAAIVVTGGRIAEVRALEQPSGDHADVTVDVSGLYLCPGLIDMHVHLCHESRAHRDVAFSHVEPSQISAHRAVQNLSEAMLHGVCLVRDVGGRDESLRDLSSHILSGRLALPEIEMAGAPFCVAGGHGHEFGQTVSGTDLSRTMAEHAAAGHTWVKVMNGPELWDPADLSRLCDAAHEHQLKVAVHAFADAGVWPAILGNADTVEHCLASSPEMAAAAASAETYFVPTAFAALTSLATSYATHLSRQEQVYLEEWLKYLETSREPHQIAGLPILIGTDAGCAPCQPQDVVGEMLQLQTWGFSAVDILDGATRRAASVLGRAEDFGEIAVGRYASVILTRDNPLETLATLCRPELILLKGIPVLDRIGACLA
jgi:imidazolonepropionase-like amidohydrolase